MGIESVSYIDDFNQNWPLGGDQANTSDQHHRLIKAGVLATFQNITGAVTATQAELNILAGALLSTADLNLLNGLAGNTLWHSGNDGNSSGLDADLWKGANYTVSTSAPSGGANGDFWFEREV